MYDLKKGACFLCLEGNPTEGNINVSSLRRFSAKCSHKLCPTIHENLSTATGRTKEAETKKIALQIRQIRWL